MSQNKVDRTNRHNLSRRSFLHMVGLTGMGALIAACTPEPEIVEVPVEVEKEVVREVEVEKEVIREVEVEKEVERLVVVGEIERVPREDTVIFGATRSVDPTGFNHLSATAFTNRGQHSCMLEPLMILNYESGEFMPWICTSIESNEDATEWTFNIRDGVEWSDGEPLDAEDLTFTINYTKEHAPNLRYSGDMDGWVDRAETVDRLTTRVYLQRPGPRFAKDFFMVKLWGALSPAPEHIFRDVEEPVEFKFWDREKGWPVNSGAYTVVHADENSTIYDRRDDWWGAKTGFMPLPGPKRLVWLAIPATEEGRAAALIDGTVDTVGGLTVPTILASRDRNPDIMGWDPEPPYAWLDACDRNLGFNHTVEPWDDPEMRRAINHLIDRDEIVMIAYEGHGRPSETIYVKYPVMVDNYLNQPEIREVMEKYPVQDYDPNKAFAIFEAKGYTRNGAGYWAKDGSVLNPIIEPRADITEDNKWSAMIVEQLQRHGVDAVQRPVESALWVDRGNNGEYELRADWWTCGSIADPWLSADNLHCRWVVPVGERASKNIYRWCNEEFSQLHDEMGQLHLGDPQIVTLLARMLEIFNQEMPVIPVVESMLHNVAFSNTYWTNWPSADNNYLHPPTWWASVHYMLPRLQKAT